MRENVFSSPFTRLLILARARIPQKVQDNWVRMLTSGRLPIKPRCTPVWKQSKNWSIELKEEQSSVAILNSEDLSMATAILTLPEVPSASPPILPGGSTSQVMNSKIFKVKNVDDKGRIISIGFLEVTSTHIIFQYQHYSTKAIKWPLTCIRKFGTNNGGNLFIFEAGRRAPEGEGMYAFRTKKADNIRKLLNDYTQKI